MTDDLTFEYTSPITDGRHTWSVVGPLGGVHIWAQSANADHSDPDRERFCGGIEVPSRKPTYEADTPSHDECWLIGGPCWHDGSSLYFSERLEPRIRFAPQPFNAGIHEAMNNTLLDWYHTNLEADK